MLENFFNELPNHLPETYAVAYDKYRNGVQAVLDSADEIVEEMDSIELDFPVRLGFKAMYTKDGTAVLGEELTFEKLSSFLYTDVNGKIKYAKNRQ